MSDERARTVQCCIAGGGPAGVMLGYLLARSGIDVLVLEKHADFLRDFRGDTIHPSTLQILNELGVLGAFLTHPHSEVTELTARIGDTTIALATFAHVPGPCQFIAFMPQWDFLDFLVGRARSFPSFHIEMQAEATDLLMDGDRAIGLRAQTPAGPLTVHADLVVAADGRHSALRARAGLEVENIGAPIDVLWMRLSRRPDDPGQTFGNIAAGGVLVAINRNDYYQCALVIRKGGFDDIRAGGLERLRADVAHLAPFLRDRVDELQNWDQVQLLSVTVDRLKTWYRPGFLCIGDAAHAMSPVGGVGINLAIADAVAAANRLVGPLQAGAPGAHDLRAVQRRRELPTRLMQGLQVFIQRRVLGRVLSSTSMTTAPWVLRALTSIPLVRRVPALIVGFGFLPEHVRTLARPPASGPD